MKNVKKTKSSVWKVRENMRTADKKECWIYHGCRVEAGV